MYYKKEKDLLKLLDEVRIEYILLSDKIVEEKTIAYRNRPE